MRVSVIVPCHNEAGAVGKAYRRIKTVLEHMETDYEIIFEEDGSTDGTNRVITELSNKDPKVIALSFPSVRKGKGWGFRRLAEAATGDAVISMDADLSVSPEVIPAFLDEMSRADIVIAGRYSHPESKIPLRRRIPSRAYNTLLRILFNIQANDTQSGFKAFRRNSLMKILPDASGFEYDIEMLAKARQQGLSIREMPVKYIYRKDARFSVMSHGPKTLARTLILWKRLKAAKA